MSNAAALFTAFAGHGEHDDVWDEARDDAFRARILLALGDLRARERRASAPDLACVAGVASVRLGEAANDGTV